MAEAPDQHQAPAPSQPTPDDAWHYAADGQQSGPVPKSRLGELIRSGALSADSLVWKPGMPDWIRIGLLDELQEFGAAPPTRPGALRAPPQPTDSDPAVRLLIPVGRSPWAIAAGYLGLVSVLLLFAPFAIITGCIAIYDIQKHPARHGMVRSVFGILMGVASLAGYLVLMAR